MNTPQPASVSASPSTSTEFAEIDWRGQALRLEYAWVGAQASAHPPVVFLHEGLGSIGLWKDFPERFCRAHGLRGLVFSRYGYGRSTPRPHGERWPVDFMERQAWEVLPALFRQLGIVRPWLFGHSDGASIALLYAARFGADLGGTDLGGTDLGGADLSGTGLSGIIVLAPHIMVEEIALDAIRQARAAYLAGPLRARLARHHADVDSAFWGWNDIWLDPAFRGWDIRAEVAGIRVPLLAIQGEGDEYATLEQVEGIARLVPQARLLVLPQCGHSPHFHQAQRVIDAAGRFILDHP